jgi:hypothetical protein
MSWPPFGPRTTYLGTGGYGVLRLPSGWLVTRAWPGETRSPRGTRRRRPGSRVAAHAYGQQEAWCRR